MLGEEPVNNDFEMALAEMIDKSRTSVIESLVIAAQWKDELIKLAKSEESVSEEWVEELRTKLDSLSKENFKKVFDKYAVDFNEVPVSEIDFEQELYKYFGQVKDFTLGMRIAKRFYEIGRNHQEPVSEELNTVAKEYADNITDKIGYKLQLRRAVVYGANWQLNQIRKENEKNRD